ncbi:3-methyl-2-oxobutanoate hydroxymethyltransferase [bacterium]|nr:MAG: 3-methyl-2-oxobutanoate hydroxymethyltransferase [bacterium]RKZ17948.1 MAG: 3-methyl-2-oxobutanoate hydroxymethyltransferase [bacterium]
MKARKKVTHRHLLAMKKAHQPVVVMTAYDHYSARIADDAGVDVILVGDSLGMVIQGHDSTLPVTVEHMLYHTACVTRVKPNSMVVADLPFGTFQRGPEVALDASLRLVQESAAEAVKVEGAGNRLRAIEAIVDADIPVWGHVGLTPQSVHALGGYRVQGREEKAAASLLQAARRVQEAGASAIVLECIPHQLAAEISGELQIPTIGIGAGPSCDGQVLVFHDLLGFDDGFRPRFVRRYAEAHQTFGEAVAGFAADVRSGGFPTLDESFANTTEVADAPAERTQRHS